MADRLTVSGGEEECFAWALEVFVDSAACVLYAVGYLVVFERRFAMMNVLQGGVYELFDVVFYLSGNAREEAFEDVENGDESPELEEKHAFPVAGLLAFVGLTSFGRHLLDFAG